MRSLREFTMLVAMPPSDGYAEKSARELVDTTCSVILIPDVFTL